MIRPLLIIALLAGCQHGGTARGNAREATCEAIAPDHDAAERATKSAYARALEAKALTPIVPEELPIERYEQENEVDMKAFGQAITPWTPVTYAGRTVIASEIYMPSYEPKDPVELVKDAHGGLWRVKRAPHAVPFKTFRVKTCSWGCWGWPGAGAVMQPQYTRDVWAVPAGLTFRGDIDVAYDAPTVMLEIVDQHCAPPP